MIGYVWGTTRWWPLTANPTQGFGNPDRAEHLQGVTRQTQGGFSMILSQSQISIKGSIFLERKPVFMSREVIKWS